MNRIDTAVLTASSEIATLPVNNIVNPHLVKRWHTVAGVITASVLADFSTSSSVGALGIFGTNLSSGATVRLRGSNSDPTGIAGEVFDSGVLSSLVSNTYRNVYYALSANLSARYWLINLVDASLPNLQIGRVFLGPTWTPSNSMNFGWGNRIADESIVFKSRGGQTFVDVGPSRRVFRATIGIFYEDEIYTNAFELARANGRIKDILVIPRETGNFRSEQSIWGLLIDTAPVTNAQGRGWNVSLEIEERL